jgi:hypothetical protein
MNEQATSAKPIVTLISLAWKPDDWSFSFTLSAWVAAATILCLVAILVWRLWAGSFGLKDMEIDQAEIGVGSQKLRLKPNSTAKQIAYAIWVELSTRKIGLEIDFEHDVIAEIYDSWYTFFAVTRELIKGISVTQIKNESTRTVIGLSIDVLNIGLRPHLTRWQARFRHWYERELKRHEGEGAGEVIDPQALQKQFPNYEELKADMERVNRQLIAYRQKMNEIIFNG